jgi:protein TonB
MRLMLLLIWTSVSVVFAQEQPKEEPLPDMPAVSTAIEEPNKIYERVELEPLFGNDHRQLTPWLKENIANARQTNKKLPKGSVTVMVIVEKDGTLTSPEFVDKINMRLKKESLKLLVKMPAWRPAVQNGRPVRAYTTLTFDW